MKKFEYTKYPSTGYTKDFCIIYLGDKALGNPLTEGQAEFVCKWLNSVRDYELMNKENEDNNYLGDSNV